MGCFFSKSEEDERSKKIDLKLKEGRLRQNRTIKLLLLGAGESGKSTIAKQMKIMFEDGYSNQERRALRGVVFHNTKQAFAIILRSMDELRIPFDDNRRIEDARLFFGYHTNEITDNDEIPRNIAVAMTQLWMDPGFKECYARASEYQLNDSAAYYLNSLERIAETDYVPTVEDVVRSRVRTSGTIETHFDYKGLHFQLFDVGGRRTERKKWIDCFEGVSAIIFCVVLSEYDMMLMEDPEMNRMADSMKLFDSVVNNTLLAESTIMLFLNKTDLFKTKINRTPLSICFPEYPGGNNYQEASQYIETQFDKLNERRGEKDIYTHFTCATDTDNIKFLFDIVTAVIINHNLAQFGPL